MKIEKFQDGEVERRVLIAMIVSKDVLASVAQRWEEGLFTSPDCNMIAKWCISHWKAHKNAPGKAIETRFAEWSTSKRVDPKKKERVEEFLAACSDEWQSLSKEINAPHMREVADRLFRRNKLRTLSDSLQSLTDDGKLEEAEQRLQEFKRIGIGRDTPTDLLLDDQAITEAFERNEQDTLIRLDGDRGRFFDGSLARSELVAFIGPEKRGKTWTLIDLAWEAMLQRRRVLFFSISDMSRKQIMPRFLVRAARRPWKDQVVEYPLKIEFTDEGKPKVNFREENFAEGLRESPEQGKRAFYKVQYNKVKSHKSFFKLLCLPSASVERIKTITLDQAQQDWIADVVVIDYADVLRSPRQRDDHRHEINDVWCALRELSLEMNCLVLTATQGTRASYSAKTILMEHASEDKRKNAWVTGMIGLNQTPMEKSLNLMRLNWAARREGAFSPFRCLWMAQCLPLGRPCVVSHYDALKKDDT